MRVACAGAGPASRARGPAASSSGRGPPRGGGERAARGGAQRLRLRRARAAAESAAAGSAERQALAALLDEVAPLRRGIELTRGGGDATRARLFALAEELRACSRGSASAARINDTWELVATTEKETLFILEKFAAADEVYQVIELEEDGSRGRLYNIIRFGSEERQFLVSSDIEAADDAENRIRFEFSGAEFQWDSLRLPLPPFGKGWFDVVHVDDVYRVALDSRGDLLICRRSDYKYRAPQA